MNQSQSLSKLGNKDLAPTQVITKEALNIQQGVGLVTALNGLCLQVLGHGVINENGLALLVDTVQETEPCGDDKYEALKVVGASHDVLSNGRHDELWQLAGAIEGETVHLVHDGRVGKTLQKGIAVLVDINTLDAGHEGLDLLVHHVVDESSEERVLENLVHIDKLGQVGSIGNGRVAGVEQTQLVALKLLDIVDVADDLDTDLLELGATANKCILHNPLGKGLGNNRPRVLDTKLLGQGELILIGRSGSNAVHHAVGEETLAGDPIDQLGVARTSKAQQHVSGDAAIALHVVA